ncbi:MAG: hypothetical protein V1881_03200, partial [Candidatus Micrarchaeota archaeon]
YGLSNKSEAFNRIVHEFGPQMIEPELKERFAKDVLEGTGKWEKKHAFGRKTTLKELDGL